MPFALPCLGGAARAFISPTAPEDGVQEKHMPEESKRCGRCGSAKSVCHFARCMRDGRHGWCKACDCEYQRARRLRLRSAWAEEAGEPEEAREPEAGEAAMEDSGSERPAFGTHLYIFQNSSLPGLLKVGCSNDPAARAKQLESGHPFRIAQLAVCSNLGHLEHSVHHRLHPFRFGGGSGREWFAVSLADALRAVACAAEEEQRAA